MTLWQFFAIQEGFINFHTPKTTGDGTPQAPSDDEFDAMKARLAEEEAREAAMRA